MSADFVKVYSSFWTGSLRDQPPYARLLFLSLLDLCDETGEVRATPAYIAAHAALSEADVKDGLDRLAQPDPESHNPDEEGRRILRTGTQAWRIVNYRKYYEMHRAEERREYLKEAKRKERSAKCQHVSTNVNTSTMKEKEKEKEKEKKPPKEAIARLTPLSLLGVGFQTPSLSEAYEKYDKMRIEKRVKPWTKTTVEERAKQWAAFEPSQVEAALRRSVSCGWQGVFPEREPSSSSSASEREQILAKLNAEEVR